ncbi:hypothetical protein CU313_05180 [Prochlorococcus marinus str. MU1404]|uniref:hypothetical protein n=1 Tax=Prochlorococcus marinus TaxID=1219 RepID=UPI001ADC7B4A|nr:hypothetical protein [Prochlorococcus marinus]MBO8229966.1 hypothetical protein [Prochlorococcus marinus XMU1404]MBW3073259.1 hypothetical protein [Prochlorococcus marinus str. MU1404]MCR8545697.1 hypothetical protein [Prochlorococcus marinus CUG1432]
MKSVLNLCFFLFALLIIGDKSFSLTNYQIKRICKPERRVSNCIKSLQEKKLDLKKGKLIEIPVIPFKK